MSARKDAAEEASIARSNLNTWAAVIALLESGLLAGPSINYQGAASKVIKIAKAQTQKELTRYDRAMAKVERAQRSR